MPLFWRKKKDNQEHLPASPEWPSFSGQTQPPSIDSRSQTSKSQNSTGIAKEDRLGMFVYEDQDEKDPDAIDIVALHGLNGHWEKTWQATTRNGDQVVWLRDLLPQQIPHARIMSFGYDSVLQFSKSVADIGTFAEQLLEDLMSRRSGLAVKRPIIFICHSLGGIVVKKTIVRAHEKDRYKDLLNAVKGIVFFGTPHRGSSLANWSTLLGNVASGVSLGTKTNKRLSKDLESQSQVLQEISKSFIDRARNLQLVSFYETDKMDFLNCRVVEEESAILGFPNEVTIAMKGNHRSMCRFAAIDEKRYRHVWTNLQNMAGSAVREKIVEDTFLDSSNSEDDDGSNAEQSFKELAKEMEGPSRSSTSNTIVATDLDIVEALEKKWLGEVAIKKGRINGQSYTNSTRNQPDSNVRLSLADQNVREAEKKRRADEKKNRGDSTKDRVNAERNKARKAETVCYRMLRNSDYEAHRLRNPAAVPGTCQWLLHHDIFYNWRRKEASDLLWLSADPGCGKSVLTSYLVDHLKNVDNSLKVPEIVLYFFFKEDNNEQDNSLRAISALLHQLYTAQPWLLEHATQAFMAEGRAVLAQFNTLWNIFMASITDLRSRDIILILDGLDECEPNTRHQLLQSLGRVYQTGSKGLNQPPYIKTIVASRPDNDIKIAFDMLPTIRLRGEDEPEAISEDVALVIKDHIEKAVLRGLPRSILGDLEKGLIRGADRTFLWTTMVIDLLEAKQGASKKDLLEILHSRDLYRIYHRLLEDSSDQEEARRLLHIVIAAVRPLTLAELSIAMSVSPTQMTLEDLEGDIVYNFEERIKALCGNFIRIVRSTVYLVHQTAREFLLQERQDQPPKFGKWQHSFILRESHSQVLDICLQYLAFLNVKSSQSRDNEARYDPSTTKFVEYAGQFWTHHYSELAPSLTPSQLSQCAQLCNSNAPGFGRWFKSASAYARNPKHELREGTMQRDIAHFLGLEQVVQLLDQLMEPGEVAWVDENQPTPGTSADVRRGSVSIRNPRESDILIQPHTISPGHWETSPLSVAMAKGLSLDARLQPESPPVKGYE